MTVIQKHRCAVCWAEQTGHEAWFAHAVEVHSAVLAEFGFERCISNDQCPGVIHAKRLRTEGTATQRTRPEPAPFTARDGTTYTPVPLFEDRSA